MAPTSHPGRWLAGLTLLPVAGTLVAAALQYVRKISGSTKPSQANEEAFSQAVEEVAHRLESAECGTSVAVELVRRR